MSKQVDFVKNLTATVRENWSPITEQLLRDIILEIVKAAPPKYLAMLGDCISEINYEIFKERN